MQIHDFVVKLRLLSAVLILARRIGRVLQVPGAYNPHTEVDVPAKFRVEVISFRGRRSLTSGHYKTRWRLKEDIFTALAPAPKTNPSALSSMHLLEDTKSTLCVIAVSSTA